MNHRESFRAMMDFERPDGLCQFEWGYWGETIFRILGGIDKREIAKGKEAIDKELMSKLPFMFKCGGYIPSMDHHVPPEVSYEDFKYYLRRCKEIWSSV